MALGISDCSNNKEEGKEEGPSTVGHAVWERVNDFGHGITRKAFWPQDNPDKNTNLKIRKDSCWLAFFINDVHQKS